LIMLVGCASFLPDQAVRDLVGALSAGRSRPRTALMPFPTPPQVETVRSIWPTLVAIAFVHLISPRAVSIPEPALIFTVPVAFATVRGGRLLGLLAASIALADVGFSLYASGDHVARFDQDAMVRLGRDGLLFTGTGSPCRAISRSDARGRRPPS
jgi:hypothetical protein